MIVFFCGRCVTNVILLSTLSIYVEIKNNSYPLPRHTAIVGYIFPFRYIDISV